MALALRRLSSSLKKPIFSNGGSLRSMSSTPASERSRSTWISQLNAPLEEIDPEIADIIELEKARQWKGFELIPSENFTSASVMEAVGSVMTNKYSEGYPGARYYGGNEYIDMAESLCQKRALEAFHLDPSKWGVNVQSLSGSPANFQVYTALLKPHERIMALDLPHGGHLSHGYQVKTPEYKAYQDQVLRNCSKFAETLLSKGYDLVSGGTENHLVLVNLKNKGIDGSRVEKVLESVHIAANKNTVPGDVSAMVPGGIRMGTPALTSRGFIEEDFAKVAEYFDLAVKIALKIKAESQGTKLKDFVATMQSNEKLQSEMAKLREMVEEYAKQFPTIGFEKETMRYKE